MLSNTIQNNLVLTSTIHLEPLSSFSLNQDLGEKGRKEINISQFQYDNLLT